jgi:hypothetical protein
MINKILLAVALLLPVTLPAQTFSIDLVKVKDTLAGHHNDPPRVKWRRITAGIAAAASIGDITTTYRGTRQGACELNPFLHLEDKCTLNSRRFNLVKLGVFLYLGPGEELMHRLPHGHIWDRENIILNSGIAVLYSTVTISNINQLRK